MSDAGRSSPVDGDDLLQTLIVEDAAELLGGLAPDDRQTCATHRAWATDCAADLLHANPVTGWNWCRPCGGPVVSCGCVPLLPGL